MKHLSISKSLLLLGLFSLLFLSLGTNKLMLYSLDEAKNAECAREMFERSDWVVPTFNGELRTDKPPLHYWAMMGSYRLFGINEFAARWGSVLSGVGTILLTFFFTFRHVNRRAAWASALVLLASLHVGVQFRMAVPDPYLIFLLTLAWVSFYEWYSVAKDDGPISNWIWVFYAALGFALLAKGPIALVLTGLSILLFLIMRKELRLIPHMQVIWGVQIIFLIALPWYVAVHEATGGAWTEGFFFQHNLSRYMAPMEGHGGIFLLTPVYVLVGLLPFSIFLPQALRQAWLSRKTEAPLLFALCIAAVVIVFFSFSGTKLPNYTVPSYPFLAVLTGYFLDRMLSADHASWKNLRPALIVYGILATLLPLAFFFGLRLDPAVSHLSGWAFIFLTFPLGAAAAWYRFRHEQLNRTILALSASFIVTAVLFFQLAYPVIDRENPVSQTLAHIHPDQRVIAYKQFNPAYVFYLDKSVEVFQTPEELRNALRGPESVIVLSRTEYLPELTPVVPLREIARRRDLFETPTTVVLTKQSATAAL